VPGVSSRSLSRRVSKVKCMRVGMLSRRRVCESLLCPSAYLCDGALQLKRGRLCVSMRGSSSSMRGR
jgi:hypothetical protein